MAAGCYMSSSGSRMWSCGDNDDRRPTDEAAAAAMRCDAVGEESRWGRDERNIVKEVMNLESPNRWNVQLLRNAGGRGWIVLVGSEKRRGGQETRSIPLEMELELAPP
ncbi:hypothetical protein AXG93_93s1100 [Marchantia polymorpha subsp. ruderalis]|uniref:Uncharacterized protein n=1 Tax=Marchantia polymorpha subsp. ruderalis TaxID=1480154 RepID=A0A176WTQ5_MARPO|nr:hypothetical protein AXG93_93s1100 [Marchantia polymorpha subsp. ruderalis]